MLPSSYYFLLAERKGYSPLVKISTLVLTSELDALHEICEPYSLREEV